MPTILVRWVTEPLIVELTDDINQSGNICQQLPAYSDTLETMKNTSMENDSKKKSMEFVWLMIY